MSGWRLWVVVRLVCLSAGSLAAVVVALFLVSAASDVAVGDPGAGGASVVVAPRSCSGGLFW